MRSNDIIWTAPRTLAAACVTIAALFVAAPVEAAFKLQLSQAGFTTKTITDNVVGDANADPGQLTTFSDYGNLDVGVITAASTRLGGGAQLDSSGIIVKNKALVAKTLTIRLTDTGFGAPGAEGSLITLLNTLAISGLSGASSMTLTSYADNANTEFGTAVATPSVFIASAPLTIQKSTTFLRSTPLYSMTHIGIVTLAPGGSINFSATTKAVPEPAASALVAFGLLAWARARRRKRMPEGIRR